MKKIVIVNMLAVLIMLTISFASIVTSNSSKPIKNDSPLFGIRTRQAIREKIGNMMKRFVGERVFFLPFQWVRNLFFKKSLETASKEPTCDITCGGFPGTECFRCTSQIFCTWEDCL